MADKPETTSEEQEQLEDELEEELEEDGEEIHEGDATFAKRKDWAKPMNEPLKAPWGLTISEADLAKLKTGFVSRDMDDKWDILVEDPDPSGKISIHCLRSWTGNEVYLVQIAVVATGEASENGKAKIETIMWEGNKNEIRIDAEQAQKEVVLLLRGRLGCEFETLPEYDFSMIWDHPAYKINPDEEYVSMILVSLERF